MRYELIAPIQNNLNPLEQVLVNRGIKFEDINHFRFPTEQDILDPLLLDNMQQGAQMLISHISAGDKIMVQIDSDCDGLTSAAALINYLNRLFPHYVQTKLIYRTHTGKQHGLILETIPEDVKLVIAPDGSSSDYEVHKQLAEKNIDVLVLDHHEAEYVSPYACVINNQLCDYPTKTLSGAGIVYKFCSYIDSLLNTDYANDIIDLAAVGILADVMEIKNFEVRAILEQGMDKFTNPLLKTLVEGDSYHFGEGLNPFNITWYISPFINAICRSGTDGEKQLIFEAMLDYKAYESIPSTKRGCSGQYETRVTQAVRTMKNVKNRQTRSKEIAMDIIYEIIANENLLENKVIIVKLQKIFAVDKNLTGLIASSLADEYQRPVLILNEVIEDNKIYWRGSARGYDLGDIGNFRELLLSTGLVEYAHGHANAFGTSVPDECCIDLTRQLDNLLSDFNCSPIYKVDFIWNEKELTSNKISMIADQDKLWGKGVENPLVAIEGLKVKADNLHLYGLDKGKPVINISIPDGSSLVKFKASQEEYDNLYSELGYVLINAVGTCSKSSWGIPQIQIQDYEIVGKNEYYF